MRYTGTAGDLGMVSVRGSKTVSAGSNLSLSAEQIAERMNAQVANVQGWLKAANKPRKGGGA